MMVDESYAPKQLLVSSCFAFMIDAWLPKL
jgi:hypothetical protein